MQTLEEAYSFLSWEGWQINLDKLLRRNIGRSFGDAESETAIVETLREHCSRDGGHKFVDVIRKKTKETFDWIEDSNKKLTSARR